MNYIIAFIISSYAKAFYGSFVYNFALFTIAKGNCDKAEIDFPYFKYFKFNWDNWALTALIAPILVWNLPDILNLINSKLGISIPESSLLYLASGPATELVIFLLFKYVIKSKDSIIAPVHQ